MNLKDYLRGSRDLSLNVSLVVPALVLYQAGVWFLGPDIRNGAHLLLQELFLLLGSLGTMILEGLLVAFAVVCVIDACKKYDHVLSRLGYLVLECLVYGAMLGPLVLLLRFPMMHLEVMHLEVGGVFAVAPPGSPLQDIFEKAARAMGAGVYEELFFRLLLMSALYHVILDLLRQARWVAATVALAVSSLVFSLCHQNPEHFHFYTLAGVVLGLLFYFRGFAAAVYTHAFYNLLVFFR